ncbi:MAG: SprB repeat-containing protein [Saprospiraceae bacterium]|nr:SprB repeat-containing protein [Saprospiraceae bacterium]
MYKTLLLCCACCFGRLLSAQTIYYVNQNAGGAGTGSSWNNAFIRLQQALAVAQNGDQVWVAKGTYKPTTGNDRFVYFNLPSGVAVYGGFSGTETTLGQRNWTTNPTILSGDIGLPGDTTDNSFNILYTYSPNNKTRLDGLIIEEGNANNPDPAADAHRPTRSGGGVYVDGENFGYAELTLEHCIFRRNRAFYQGGALYANGREGGMAIVRMDDCLFERNISKTFGGGFSLENYFEQPFALEVKNCIFKENYSVVGGTAVWLRAHQAVSFEGCQFLDNRTVWGQTITFDLVDYNYPVRFSQCRLKGNGDFTIWYVGLESALNDAFFDFDSCIFEENGLPVVWIYFFDQTKVRANFGNCIFSKNDEIGNSFISAVHVNSLSTDVDAVFAHCLFYHNEDTEINATPGADVLFLNSILLAREEPFSSNVLFSGGGNFHLSHSLFNRSDCQTFDGNGVNHVFCNEGNLFNIDPLFADTAQGDFSLQTCSPIINAGSNAVADSLNLLFDLSGNPRIANTTVDIGPYERYISINATQSEASACSGDHGGIIYLNHELCEPLEVMWDNGDTTGNELTGLAPGLYFLTVTSANNVATTDTVSVAEPNPIAMNPIIHHVSCNGGFDGWIDGNASGGTPPYTYLGSGPSPWFPFNLQVGAYFVTVTDALGCTATTAATITSPDPFQWHYTIQNASCATCADGSIVFDSITGGVNPPLPTSLFGLLPGSYSTTITDAVGCYAVLQYNIGVTIGTKETNLLENLPFGPNPTPAGTEATFQNTGYEAITLHVLSAQGTLCSVQRVSAGQNLMLKALWPPGVYWLDCRSENGRRWLVKWVIF